MSINSIFVVETTLFLLEIASPHSPYFLAKLQKSFMLLCRKFPESFFCLFVLRTNLQISTEFWYQHQSASLSIIELYLIFTNPDLISDFIQHLILSWQHVQIYIVNWYNQHFHCISTRTINWQLDKIEQVE